MTDPARPFLEAIRASLDDDAPRLIYADWLDERGRPEQRALAEFIRLQIASFRAPPLSAERIACNAQAERLRREHETSWAGPLAEQGGRDFVHERGLIRSFHADDAAFREHAADWAELHPGWSELAIKSDDLTLGWLEHPVAERLTALDVTSRSTAVLLKRFTEGRPIPRLRALRLGDLNTLRSWWREMQEGPEPEPLPELTALPRLTSLSVGVSARRTSAIVEALATTSLSRRLERLAVEGSLTPESFARLASAELPRLTALTLHGSIGESEAAALSTGPLLRTVRRLRLENAVSDDHALARLARGGVLRRCEELVLHRMAIRRLEAETLLSTADVESLKSLACRVHPSPPSSAGDALAQTIAGAEGAVRLESLELTNSGIDDEGAIALATSPRLAGLKRLILRGNRIGPEGAAALANSETLGELLDLDLSHNPLHNDGIAALAAKSGLPKLVRLDVREAKFNTPDARALAESPAVEGLRWLRLGGPAAEAITRDAEAGSSLARDPRRTID